MTHGLVLGWWRWNLGSSICMASTLPNEPSLIEYFYSNYIYYIMLIKYDGEQHVSFSFIMLNISDLLYRVMLLSWWGLLELLPLVLCICLFHTVGNDKCKSPVIIIKLVSGLHTTQMDDERGKWSPLPLSYVLMYDVCVLVCSPMSTHVEARGLLWESSSILLTLFFWDKSFTEPVALLRLAGQWATRIF